MSKANENKEEKFAFQWIYPQIVNDYLVTLGTGTIAPNRRVSMKNPAAATAFIALAEKLINNQLAIITSAASTFQTDYSLNPDIALRVMGELVEINERYKHEAAALLEDYRHDK
jgi:hypothetical protein